MAFDGVLGIEAGRGDLLVGVSGAISRRTSIPAAQRVIRGMFGQLGGDLAEMGFCPA